MAAWSLQRAQSPAVVRVMTVRGIAARRQRGFTFIELLVVIVLIGILAVGSTRFLVRAAEGYSSTGQRVEMTGSGRTVLARLTAEISDALPNSLRVSGSCLEFVPMLAASRYLTLPLSSAAASMEVAVLDAQSSVTAARVAVLPDATADVYGGANPGPVSSVATLGAPDVNNVVVAAFAVAHGFNAPSANSRAWLVAEPVSFCVDGSRLFRYRGYGFLAVQPLPVNLPGSAPGRGLLAENLDEVTPDAPFRLLDVARDRAAVVDVTLDFASGGDAWTVQQAIQVRNAP